MKKLLQSLREAAGAGSPAATGRYRPGRDVLSAVHDGRCVLLDLRAEQYLGLDEVGTRIWALLEAGRSTEEVVAFLMDEYEAPREAIEADAARFVRELVQRRLVVAA